MASTIIRPCYATREEVKRALDVKAAAYNNQKIDRAIQTGSDDIDGLTQRRFYVEDTTRYKDWPNYDYSYPWRVWLDQSELADVTVNVPVVNSGGVIIPNSAIFWGDPTRPTAPFTYFELNRALNYTFGNGQTPQREISITGSFGYWLKPYPAGTLGASAASGDLTITVSEGDTPGVGDVAVVDSERMLVVDATYIDTGISFAGVATAQANDNVITVPSGPAFTAQEVIMIDSEWMLIQAIYGNTLVVKRAYDGSILAAHTSSTIRARRLLSVLRGQLGTTAASHSNSAPISIMAVPPAIKELDIAEAVTVLTGHSSAWAGTGATPSQSGVTLRTSGSVTFGTTVREPLPGPGLPMLRDQVLNRFGRRVRSRVI